MTKVEAIKKVMEDNNGVASWGIIYSNIEKYYPSAKSSVEWEAGIRGVLYREIRENRNFKKIGLSVFALNDYVEEKKPEKEDKIRMHSYIEGICVEIGNFKKFDTYTADPSAVFKDNIRLTDISALKKIPEFTYPEIVQEVKRIDVIWFNKRGFKFPQRVFEIVDSIGTLTGAFNRSLQLLNFKAEFYIVAPEQHKAKFEQTVHLEPYNKNIDNFKFINYDDIIALYENAKLVNVLENKIF
jgi:hypothetical protein